MVTKPMPKSFSTACPQEQTTKSAASSSETQVKRSNAQSASFSEMLENARDEYSVGDL